MSQNNNNSNNSSSAAVMKNALIGVAILFGLLAVLFLGLVTWWFYSHFVAEPEPVGQVEVPPGAAPVLNAIHSVNKQTFIEHDITVPLIYSEAPKGWIGKLGLKQEMVVLIRGKAPAGFDLSQLDERDVWVSKDGKRVQLTLPPPVIFEENVAIDFEDSQILTQSDLCPDFLCKNSLEAYNDQVLPDAKRLIIDTAQENGILNQAARDGKVYYKQLLESLGFEEVRVIVDGYE